MSGRLYGKRHHRNVHITLTSTEGPEFTTIKSPISNFYVVYITQTNVTINGFRIVAAGIADGDIAVYVATGGVANARILHNIVISGRLGINLICGGSNNTVAYNIVNGAFEAGINVDTCEAPPFPGSSYNSVHHNKVCSSTYPYSIAVGGGLATGNTIDHNIATWISVGGVGNVVHDNAARAFLIAPGNPASNNTLADTCY